MKNILLIFILLFLSFPSHAFAHTGGLPEFFLINGKETLTTPSQTVGILPPHILTTQDIGAETYVVNQPLTFLIDTHKLEKVLPKELLATLLYTWDFGDGEKGSGVTNTHRYAKPGSYVLSITANIDETTTPTLIESVQIIVVPTTNYLLPTANMSVNNRMVKDPLQDFFKIDFARPVSFDATITRQGTAPIIKYFWDFGDGKTSDQIRAVHTYSPDQSYATPFLRVTDANGLTSDTFVTLTNHQSQQKQNPLLLPFFIGASIILILITSISTWILLKK